MALLVYLFIATMLSAMAYVISAKALWNHRATALDAEQSVAVEIPEPKVGGLEKEAIDVSSPANWSPVSERDARAADTQLLAEFAAVAASDYALYNKTTRLPEEATEPVLYVNAKQYDRIMKRRAARLRLEESLRLVNVPAKRRMMRKSDVMGGTMMGLS